MAMAKNYTLQRLRTARTRASNSVRRSIEHLLTGEAKWTITGQPTERQDVLPSWWPFWSDVLKKNVQDAVRAARELEAAGGGEQPPAGLTDAQERMLDCIRKAAGPDGWANWDHVYPDWEPTNVPVQFGGRAAQLVWAALERRGLVEQRQPDMKIRVVEKK